MTSPGSLSQANVKNVKHQHLPQLTAEVGSIIVSCERPQEKRETIEAASTHQVTSYLVNPSVSRDSDVIVGQTQAFGQHVHSLIKLEHVQFEEQRSQSVVVEVGDVCSDYFPINDHSKRSWPWLLSLPPSPLLCYSLQH
ncbi:unnamed protein product [Pleuronectes platessa]|uniref:Uncharacterized protein n=1 Tax=Pleuronectes platessa TaxID=8262 RepID=A0A9N7Y9M5_PLEPL|nr:unnamed protein product [Pleuronectes platessa]